MTKLCFKNWRKHNLEQIIEKIHEDIFKLPSLYYKITTDVVNKNIDELVLYEYNRYLEDVKDSSI